MHNRSLDFHAGGSQIHMTGNQAVSNWQSMSAFLRQCAAGVTICRLPQQKYKLALQRPRTAIGIHKDRHRKGTQNLYQRTYPMAEGPATDDGHAPSLGRGMAAASPSSAGGVLGARFSPRGVSGGEIAPSRMLLPFG